MWDCQCRGRRRRMLTGSPYCTWSMTIALVIFIIGALSLPLCENIKLDWFLEDLLFVCVLPNGQQF